MILNKNKNSTQTIPETKAQFTRKGSQQTVTSCVRYIQFDIIKPDWIIKKKKKEPQNVPHVTCNKMNTAVLHGQ